MGDWKRVIYITSVLSTWLGLVMMYLFFVAVSKSNLLPALVFGGISLLLLDPFITFVSDRAIGITEGLITILFGGAMAYVTIKYLISAILSAIPIKIL